MGALRELLALFQIQVDTKDLQRGGEKVDGFVKKLGTAGKLLAEALAVRAVKDFFAEQIENAARLQDLSNRLDLSAVAIRSFGFAARDAGIDVETAAHGMGILQKNIGLAKLGGKEQAEGFQKLGVALKGAHGEARPFNAILGDLAEGFSKIPDHETRAALAMKVMGRQGLELLPIFSKGREALEEMLGESEELSSGLGNDFYEAAKRTEDKVQHLTFAVQGLKERALAAALPVLEKAVDWFTRTTKAVIGFTQRTNVLSTGMIFLGAIAAYKLLGALQAIAKWMGILEGEALLPVAGLALLYLAFDDLFTFLQGGKSVIGDIVDSIFGVGTSASLTKGNLEELGFAGEASAVLILTAFNPVLGMLAALALAAQKVIDLIDKAKYGNETPEQHAARMQRESPENKALWEKAQAAGKAQRERDQADYKSGKKSGSVSIGPITTSADAYGPHGEYNPLRDKAGLSDQEKAYNIMIARQFGGDIPFTPYAGATKAGQAPTLAPGVTNYETHVIVNGVPTDRAHKVAGAVGTEVDRVHKKNAANTLASRKVP